MDTLSTVTKLIEKDCFMASIDLKDAYYSVRIAKTDRHRRTRRGGWGGGDTGGQNGLVTRAKSSYRQVRKSCMVVSPYRFP